MARDTSNSPRESTNSQEGTPLRARDILGNFTDTINESLSTLESKFNEVSNNVKEALANIIKDVPILNEIFANFISEALEIGEEIDNLSSGELDSRVLERAENLGVELTETQRNIYNWSRESINFWNNNLPEGVPAMPPRAIGWLFGVFQSESNFRVDAANSRSSARGLGQFLTRTWDGYIERYGGKLVQENLFTQSQLQNPNARTENPKLMVYMTTKYLINSYQSLARNGLVPQGWQTPNIEFMLYVIHHHGSGDGPKYIKAGLRDSNGQYVYSAQERQSFLDSMRHQHHRNSNHWADLHENYASVTGRRMQNWGEILTRNNADSA